MPTASEQGEFHQLSGDLYTRPVCDDLNGHCLSGSCTNNFLPNTTKCDNSTGVCVDDAYCTGLSPVCPSLPHKPNLSFCTPSLTNNQCEYNLTGSCLSGICVNTLKPVLTLCQSSGSECYLDSVCDGISGTCPANVMKPDGTSCTEPAFVLPCEEYTCVAGTCTSSAKPATSPCNTTFNECIISGSCDGSSKSCTVLVSQPDNTPCTSHIDVVSSRVSCLTIFYNTLP